MWSACNRFLRNEMVIYREGAAGRWRDAPVPEPDTPFTMASGGAALYSSSKRARHTLHCDG